MDQAYSLDKLCSKLAWLNLVLRSASKWFRTPITKLSSSLYRFYKFYLLFSIFIELPLLSSFLLFIINQFCKKNGTSFNFTSQQIWKPSFYENFSPFDFSYKEKVINIYVTQIDQKQIIDSGTTNHIAWDNEYHDADIYKTYNIEQTIQGTRGTFTAIGVSSV